jgi:hypothetical protein
MLEDRERLAREAVRKVKKNASQLFSKEESQSRWRAYMEQQNIEKIVDLARAGDKDAVEILRTHARGARGAGMNVPNDLHEFVWEWFIDGPPKGTSGTSPKDMWLNYLVIAHLVNIVSQDYGFPAYTPWEHRDDPDAPMTACRLIAEELRLSNRRVEEIWAAWKPVATRPPSPL